MAVDGGFDEAENRDADSKFALPAAAIAEIVAGAGKGPAMLLIAGSLYLAGAVLAENQ